MRPLCFLGFSLLLAAASMAGEAAPEPKGATPSPIRFVMHRLGSVRSEACGVADFNGDGKLDIVAGPFHYLAPDWKSTRIRALRGTVDDQGKGYVDDFANLPLDVDGDGKPDVVSCGWFSQSIAWYRNALGATGEWPEELADKNGNFECADLVDIDSDGKASEILPHTQQTVWYEVGALASGRRGLVRHVVSTKTMNFGAGVGDINGDGRPDVLRPDAWFEAPADPRQGKWIEHPWALGAKDGKTDHTPQILVYDVNRDGLNDVITSNAHKFGIFWYEQVREGQNITWKQHVIDDSWSQPHAIALADLDGDGELELLAGKRFMAHNGSDPDETAPLGVYWYKPRRGPSPTWTKHVISYNEGVGAGMSIWVVDLDGDGDLDIVVTGKFGGPVWFENKRK